MIHGTVNASLAVVIPLPLFSGTNQRFTFDSEVDTGFDEFLTLPIALARSLGLTPASHQHMALADGSVVRVETYDLTIEWDGQSRTVRILAMGDVPLVGNKLLLDHKITIELKPGGAVTIERLP